MTKKSQKIELFNIDNLVKEDIMFKTIISNYAKSNFLSKGVKSEKILSSQRSQMNGFR
jgi:hypothetical protein